MTFKSLRLQCVRPSWRFPDEFGCVLMLFSVFLPAAHMKVPTEEHFTEVFYLVCVCFLQNVLLCVSQQNQLFVFLYISM